MTFPQIHGNGTTAEALARQYSEAYAALEAARDILKASAPNGRDYASSWARTSKGVDDHVDR